MKQREITGRCYFENLTKTESVVIWIKVWTAEAARTVEISSTVLDEPAEWTCAVSPRK
jgi:hypothetical protein